MKIKHFIPILVSLLFLSVSRLFVNASVSVVLKSELPYEVHQMLTTNDTLIIQGWAFINSNQHFTDETTHTITIEFTSTNDRFSVATTLVDHDMTQLMFYRGSRMCGANEYNKSSSICNYTYQNVGFDATIDFNRFLPNEKYSAMIVVVAKQTNKVVKTQLYFPMKEQIIQPYDDYEFTISSNINETKLTITHSNVVVRDGPGQNYSVIRAGQTCSVTYGNQLFYRKDRVFNHIYDKSVLNLVTYYQIKGQIDGCYNQRQRVREGIEIDSMWIASPFIEYGGLMLTITNKLINKAPKLQIDHPTINRGNRFYPLDFTQAFDHEEGDLSDKIKVISSDVNKDIVGIYHVVLRVEDKHGYFDQQTMIVTVIDNNHPPVIFAEDRIIRQYSVFNPLDGVYAYDNEDGNLTHQLVVLNYVDTSVLNKQNQCYSVTDSEIVTTTTCVVITVIQALEITQSRFASKHIDIRSNELWNAYQNIFDREMTNEVTILEYSMSQ